MATPLPKDVFVAGSILVKDEDREKGLVRINYQPGLTEFASLALGFGAGSMAMKVLWQVFVYARQIAKAWGCLPDSKPDYVIPAERVLRSVDLEYWAARNGYVKKEG